MSDFEKVIEKFPSKRKFYSSLTPRKTTDKKKISMFLMFEINLK